MLSPTDESRSPSSVQYHGFAFRGTGSALFALVVKNMLLTLATLGVYLPWAKTERRKFIWQNIEVAGHRLRYHGTGRELFGGYVKVVAGYLVFVGLPALVTRLGGKLAGGLVQGVLLLVFLPLIPYAIWASRRYLLSRTSWRGIRLRLEGPAGPYVSTFFKGYLLTILTLGIYGPIWLNRLHRLMVEHSAIGTQPFAYHGADREAFRLGMRGFFLTLLTFGLYSFWYQAALARFQLRNTWFDGAHGELNMTGGDFLKLTLLQVFGLTLSLGLAFPWITTYSLQFVLERMRFVGPVDFARVYPAASEGSAAADGLADAMDVGLAI